MDYKKRKEEIEKEFQKALQQRNQLNILIEQLRGRYQEIEQLEKDEKKK